MQSSSAYGVNCNSEALSYNPPWQKNEWVNESVVMGWENCMLPMSHIFSGIGKSFNLTGYWVWGSTNGCAVGVYLPSYSGSAPSPSTARCETLIFGAIVDSCSITTIPSSMGSVNVVINPAYMGGTLQGAQANDGYPSYIVSPTVPFYLLEKGTLVNPLEEQPPSSVPSLIPVMLNQTTNPEQGGNAAAIADLRRCVPWVRCGELAGRIGLGRVVMIR